MMVGLIPLGLFCTFKLSNSNAVSKPKMLPYDTTVYCSQPCGNIIIVDFENMDKSDA